MAAIGGGTVGAATLALPAAVATLPRALAPLCALLWWLSVWLSTLPLLYARSAIGAGVNVAHADTSDGSGLARASRALYAGSFSALLLAPPGSAAFGVGAGLLALLPLLWPFGTLPPARVLLSWAAEQWLVGAHGGSACATDERTALALALSWLAALGVGVAASSSTAAAVVIAAGCGQLLALPLPLCTAAPAGGGPAGAAAAFALTGGRVPGAGARRLSTLGETVLALAGCGGGAIALAAGARGGGAAAAARDATLALDCALLCVWAAHALSAHLQRPRPLRGLVRTARWLRSPRVVHALRQVHAALQLPLPSCTAFVVSSHVLLLHATLGTGARRGVVPAATYAILLCRAARWPWQAPARAAAEACVVLWLRRALRVAPGLGGWLARADFDDFALCGALALAAFAHDRTRRFCSCVHAQLCMLSSVRADPKQGFAGAQAVLRASTLAFPLLLVVAALAALLAAPLLPLLGLPVFVVAFPRPARFWPLHGLQIDAAHATRPPNARAAAGAADGGARAESEEAAMANADAAAYAQLADELAAVVLPRALADGRLHGGAGCSSGALFLLRLDEAICIVQVAEAGYRHATVVLRGLERVVTSCHNVEGGALDALNAAVLDGERDEPTRGGGARAAPRAAATRATASTADSDEGDGPSSESSPSTRLLLSAYAPLARARVRAYSIASSQLLGLLHDRERLRWASDAFAFALVHALRARQHAGGKGSGGLPDEWWQLLAEHADADINAASSAGKPTRVAPGRYSRPLPHTAVGVGEDGPVPFPYAFDAHCCAALALDPSQTARKSPPAPSARAGQTSPKVIRLVLWVHATFESFGLRAGTAVDAGVSHVLRNFDGVPARSEQLDALREQSPELFRLALRAYRHAAKLAIDAAATFHIDDLWDERECEPIYSELVQMADERQWHVGPVGGAGWSDAMAKRTARLFGLRRGSTAASHGVQLLTLRDELATIGSWSSAVVGALWASLSVELLFAANDDDERYSIQANSRLLRNLAVQAAASPLGYPAYSAAPRLCQLALPHDAVLSHASGAPVLSRRGSVLPLAPAGAARARARASGALHGAHAETHVSPERSGRAPAATAPRRAAADAPTAAALARDRVPEGDGVVAFCADTPDDVDAGAGGAALEPTPPHAGASAKCANASAAPPDAERAAPSGPRAASPKSPERTRTCGQHGGASAHLARASSASPLHGGGAPTPHGPGVRLHDMPPPRVDAAPRAHASRSPKRGAQSKSAPMRTPLSSGVDGLPALASAADAPSCAVLPAASASPPLRALAPAPAAGGCAACAATAIAQSVRSTASDGGLLGLGDSLRDGVPSLTSGWPATPTRACLRRPSTERSGDGFDELGGNRADSGAEARVDGASTRASAPRGVAGVAHAPPAGSAHVARRGSGGSPCASKDGVGAHLATLGALVSAQSGAARPPIRRAQRASDDGVGRRDGAGSTPLATPLSRALSIGSCNGSDGMRHGACGSVAMNTLRGDGYQRAESWHEGRMAGVAELAPGSAWGGTSAARDALRSEMTPRGVLVDELDDLDKLFDEVDALILPE